MRKSKIKIKLQNSKLRKGDVVVVLSGKDKGKKSKILSMIREKNKIIVEGINQVKRRRQPKKSGEKGQVIVISQPIHASNLALYCNNCKRGVRTRAFMEGTKKVRICVKCKEVI